jgi:hypothetical protein
MIWHFLGRACFRRAAPVPAFPWFPRLRRRIASLRRGECFSSLDARTCKNSLQVATAELSARARTVSLKYMRHDDKAGAKKSERDCYVEHGTHP